MEKFWLCTRCNSSSHWNHRFTASSWWFDSSAKPRCLLASLTPQTSVFCYQTLYKACNKLVPHHFPFSSVECTGVHAYVHMCMWMHKHLCAWGQRPGVDILHLIHWGRVSQSSGPGGMALLLANFIWGSLVLPTEARVTGVRPCPLIIYVKSRESNSGPQPCRESTLTTKTSRFSFMISLFFMKVTMLPCGVLSVNANTKFYIADSFLNFSLTFS